MTAKKLRKYTTTETWISASPERLAELESEARKIAASYPYDPEKFVIPGDFIEIIMNEVFECKDLQKLVWLLAGKELPNE